MIISKIFMNMTHDYSWRNSYSTCTDICFDPSINDELMVDLLKIILHSAMVKKDIKLFNNNIYKGRSKESFYFRFNIEDFNSCKIIVEDLIGVCDLIKEGTFIFADEYKDFEKLYINNMSFVQEFADCMKTILLNKQYNFYYQCLDGSN